MNPQTPDHDDSDFESRLARLRPAPVAIDRDRMIFEAGRAAGRADRRTWPGLALAAGLGLIACGLGGLLARERAARTDLETRVAALAPAPTPIARAPILLDPGPPARLDPNSHFALTRLILDRGLDDFPGDCPLAPRRPAPNLPPRPAPLGIRDYGAALDL